MAAVKEKQDDIISAIYFQELAREECLRDGMPKQMLFQLTVEEQLARLHTKNGNRSAARDVAADAFRWREKLPADHFQHKVAKSRLQKYMIEQ